MADVKCPHCDNSPTMEKISNGASMSGTAHHTISTMNNYGRPVIALVIGAVSAIYSFIKLLKGSSTYKCPKCGYEKTI